ncbi:hypothetical protein Tco_1463048, partial [Tanacetum coccineum]
MKKTPGHVGSGVWCWVAIKVEYVEVGGSSLSLLEPQQFCLQGEQLMHPEDHATTPCGVKISANNSTINTGCS